jgi:hypothetical protein
MKDLEEQKTVDSRDRRMGGRKAKECDKRGEADD